MHQYCSVLFIGSPGFYLTNTSRFNATAGSPFSTISAWIGYGLISASLQLREYINGSYVPTDMFAVDYTRLGRCVMATPEPYPPLQFTIRLGGKDADIPQFLVGQHVFVAFGNDSTSARYMSPPIYLEGMFSLWDVCACVCVCVCHHCSKRVVHLNITQHITSHLSPFAVCYTV